MSDRAKTWVWDSSDTTGNDRLVLLFLADQGDDDGTNSFPSVRRIAEKCRINTATVTRVVARLEALGEVIVDRPESQGRGHYNRYTLILGRSNEAMEVLRSKTRDLRPFDRAPGKVRKGSERFTTRAPDARLPTDPLTHPPASSPVSEERSAKETARAESESRFEQHFWPVYPNRDGKKQDKRMAMGIWVKLSIEDQRDAVKGARHYAASGWRAKDAHRWLRGRMWEEWQSSATPDGPNTRGRKTGFADVMAEIREEMAQ